MLHVLTVSVYRCINECLGLQSHYGLKGKGTGGQKLFSNGSEETTLGVLMCQSENRKQRHSL